MACDIAVSTFYLDRDDKFLTEKPYELRFTPPQGFPSRNTTWTEHEQIKVKDARGNEDGFSIDRNGFQLCQLQTSLSSEDFADNSKVEATFLKEVAHCLENVLNANRVLVFDYSIRKSVPGYPVSNGKGGVYETPATIVHIDTTEAWTQHMNSSYLQELDSLKPEARYQYVNVWKPIKGPVRKWPLILCDWSTYNPDTDVISRDLVFGDGQVESTIAYYDPKHTYYYLSNQHEEEAWIMVQCDSTTGKGVLHTSCANPLSISEDPERESIEVRCMVYYEPSPQT